MTHMKQLRLDPEYKGRALNVADSATGNCLEIHSEGQILNCYYKI